MATEKLSLIEQAICNRAALTLQADIRECVDALRAKFGKDMATGVMFAQAFTDGPTGMILLGEDNVQIPTSPLKVAYSAEWIIGQIEDVLFKCSVETVQTRAVEAFVQKESFTLVELEKKS